MDPQFRNRRLAARLGIGLGIVGLLLALVTLFLPFAGSAGAASQAKTGAGTPSGGAACQPAHVITEFHFTINGKFASTLHNMVHEGDSVKAFFNIAAGCKNIPVGLVSHTSPDNTFVKAHVGEQKVFDSAKGTFNAGMHTLGPINVPPCNFQIDLSALKNKGVPGHTYSSAVGGTKPCAPSPPPPAPPTPPAKVLPLVITAPASHPAVVPSVAVAPSSATRVLGTQVTALPRTGANTGWLLTLAFTLIVAGGCLTFAAKQSGRPRAAHFTR
jgi:hypothetical protein